MPASDIFTVREIGARSVQSLGWFDRWIIRNIYGEDSTVVSLLAAYLAGVPFTTQGIPTTTLMPRPGGHVERYDVPIPDNVDPASVTGSNAWRNPIFYASSVDIPGISELWASYGFSRPFFGNTHHYFGFLPLMYTWGPAVAKEVNRNREIDALQPAYNEWKNTVDPNLEREAAAHYAWLYEDAVYDFVLLDWLEQDVNILKSEGFDAWLNALEKHMCVLDGNPNTHPAGSAWTLSLEGELLHWYFILPYLMPSQEFWPTPYYP